MIDLEPGFELVSSRESNDFASWSSGVTTAAHRFATICPSPGE
jgi:hypothetical protein